VRVWSRCGLAFDLIRAQEMEVRRVSKLRGSPICGGDSPVRLERSRHAPAARPSYASPVLVFAVVSAKTEQAIELFVRPEDAERFVAEVRDDEPELAELLRVEPVELDA
jgi:hypothetical protein